MIVKKELMMLTVAKRNPNRSQYKGSCCALVAHPEAWVDPFFNNNGHREFEPLTYGLEIRFGLL